MNPDSPVYMAMVAWCQHTWVSEFLRGATWRLASVETAHLLGLLVWFGTILVVDLRLMGWMFESQPASEISVGVQSFGSAALALQAITGPALFLATAMKMLMSITFAVKLTLLAIALTYHFTVHRRAVRAAGGAERNRGAAGVSLALWVGVATAGLWINA
ncbi:MAG TPA: DUF6644 family protein [Bryobacteraceae bacterium]|nr:DUF6644 family protein [Bryobacteraceae bacterium]